MAIEPLIKSRRGPLREMVEVYRFLQLSLVSLIATLAFSPMSALGTSASSNQHIEQAVSKILQTEISARLSPAYYFLKISAELLPVNKQSSSKNAIPFVPDSLNLSSNEKDLPSLMTAVKKLTVTLYLDKRVSKESRKTLVTIIKNSLPTADQKLVLSVKEASFPEPELDADTSGKIGSLEKTLQDLERERDDLKQKLIDFGLNASESLLEIFRKELVWIILAVVGVLAGIWGLRIFKSSIMQASANLAQPFAQIAQALGEIGNQRAEEASVIDVTAETDSLSGALPGDVHHSLSASEAIFSRVQTLREEIAKSLTEIDELYVLDYLNRELASDATAVRGVYVMELMPRDVARELFEKLGARQKNAVVKFLMAKDHPKNKTELMVEAGELFKTKLLKGHLGAIEEHVSQAVISKLQSLEPEHHVTVIQKVSTEAAQRFLLYLSPQYISRLLETVREIDTQAYGHIVDNFANIADFERRADLDNEIERTIDQIIEDEAKDTAKKYLPMFKDVLTKLDDEHSEFLIATIGQKKKSLGEALSESVITVTTFFKFGSRYQQEILEEFSNREIAALLSVLSTEQQDTIKGMFSSRRLTILSEDLERMSQKSKSEVKKLFTIARKKMITKMEAMIKEAGSAALLVATNVQAKGDESIADQNNDRQVA